MADNPLCKIDGCDKPAGLPGTAHGFCRPHYKRWYKYGDPHAGKGFLNVRQKWIDDNKSHEGDECLDWPFSKNGNGYGQFRIDGRSTLASHAMCIVAHGAMPQAGMQAAHTCGNGHLGCTNPKHLRWATRKENMADAKAHGTWVHGERHWGSKLTRQMVMEIRQSPETHEIIAKRYGVARQTVTKIKSRRTWAWLD